MRTELEVGDIIRVYDAFNKYKMKVYRVTKTLAIAKPIVDSDSFETKFKRKTYAGKYARILNEGKWSITTYTVLTLDKTKEELS